MKAMKLTLLAGAVIAATGVAIAQPATPAAPAGEMTREQAGQRAEQNFARLDANRDGRLTTEELQARGEQRAERRGGQLAERQSRMFDRLDTNRDGQLSREEFGQRMAMRGNGERRGPRGGGRMGAGMLGDDGVVTLAEFRERALQRFDRLDTDRDGRVAADERRGRRDGRRGMRAPMPQAD